MPVDYNTAFLFHDPANDLIIIVFAIIGILIAINIIKNLAQWQINNTSEVIITEATVVSKREDISISNHVVGTTGAVSRHTNTEYYVTFEKPDGNRIELKVAGKQYGLLVEGDVGLLNYQGTRFNSFKREI